MKKIIARKVALYLAVFQLFSCATMLNTKAESLNTKETTNTMYIPKSNIDSIALVTDENGKTKFQRFDKRTNEYHDISIYDFENVLTNQFGANQNAFVYNFYDLLRDELIVNEIQKRFPTEEIDELIDPTVFYKCYFEIIRRNGCGFAAGVNAIFREFEGREDEFYDAFGFPMYEINTNYRVNFNYELMLLLYFNKHIEIDSSFKLLKISIERMAYQYEIDYYTELREKYRNNNKDFKNWTAEKMLKWKETDKELEDIIQKLNVKLLNVPETSDNYAFYDSNHYTHINEFLKDYGIKFDISSKKNINDIEQDDIIACSGATVYLGNGEIFTPYFIDDVGSHCFSVAEVSIDTKGNKQYVVSSWGHMFVIDKNKTEVIKVYKLK